MAAPSCGSRYYNRGGSASTPPFSNIVVNGFIISRKVNFDTCIKKLVVNLHFYAVSMIELILALNFSLRSLL